MVLLLRQLISNHLFCILNSQVDLVTYKTKYDGTSVLTSPFAFANGTYYKRTASIHHDYKVTKQGWHNVVFVLCPESFYADPSAKPVLLSTTHSELAGMQDLPLVHKMMHVWTQKDTLGSLSHTTHTLTSTASDGTDSSTRVLSAVTPYGPKTDKYASTAFMTGTIAFRNPYGYIPAELYGVLPFQVCVYHSIVRFILFHVPLYLLCIQYMLNHYSLRYTAYCIMLVIIVHLL